MGAEVGRPKQECHAVIYSTWSMWRWIYENDETGWDYTAYLRRNDLIGLCLHFVLMNERINDRAILI